MRYLLAPLVAWAIAQAAKVTLTSVREKRLNLRVLAETGGMPADVVHAYVDFPRRFWKADADVAAAPTRGAHEERPPAVWR